MKDQRRLQDLAFLLPCFGLFLLLPPLLQLFDGAGTLFGVPLLLIYLFACWLGLILAGWRLSVLLGRASRSDEAQAAQQRAGNPGPDRAAG